MGTKTMLPEYKKLLLLLKKHKVNYILIGGFAVIYYGFERNTMDMDLWMQPTNDNKDKLLLALEDYGISVESIQLVKALDFTKPQVFFIGEKPRRIDFLTTINIVDFEEALRKVNYLKLEPDALSEQEDKVPVIEYHQLILSKITTERLKDKLDVEELQRINRNKREK